MSVVGLKDVLTIRSNWIDVWPDENGP